MTELQSKLLALSDSAYADFQARLTPTVPREKFLGVRLPVLRGFAKEFEKTSECRAFLASLPHEYYDENMLHALVLAQSRDYAQCLSDLEAFLPYVDNWAVCDSLRPKIFARHKEELLPTLREWAASPKTYTCRFGLDMLMTHYLDADFKSEYLAIPAAVTSEEYYVRMMVAWYFATALAKQWDAAIPYLEQRRLPAWTHHKTIQKACESYRITSEQKAYLRSLK